MKILCIIPIFNEDKNLKFLLDDIKTFQERKNNSNVKFLIINNNSKDKSLEILKSYNINFINLRYNKGIGYALLLGLKLAKKNNFDLLIHMAGNYKMSPFDINTMLIPILLDKANFVNGTRFIEESNYKNNPLFRKISIKILSLFISLLFNTKVTDATCGFRVFYVNQFYKYFEYFNKKKFYTYGYEYYSYGKVLISKNILSCEASIKMNYISKKKYSKIRPIIDWIPIILGYLKARYDNHKLF